ncbi:DNA ligase D [Bacillus sp. DNRA2]|uniref:DNA ligase D n=1 Tax=Bacillus sp. DNRA2 TaxID=2723053 RepID=UPI00145DF238|nr:DNA ligase D [Bacillus sp. DNRA2]NMD69979.1 DNA ligase D [Bacillus sp. DNRA2]
MKPMLPTLTFDIPEGKDWYYEVKYDGFRALLIWDQTVTLISRNGNSLLEQFPEIEQFLTANKQSFEPYLPLVLDGELVDLVNPYKSNFAGIQVRGRMRSQQRINEKSKKQPCRLLIFDLLMFKGKSFNRKPYLQRKQKLVELFSALSLPIHPSETSSRLIQLIPENQNFSTLWEQVVLHDGEGIVAKKAQHYWEEGKRTESWLKYKNWKYASCFITAMDKHNGYFHIAVYQNQVIKQIGHFIFGLTPEEKRALATILKENKTHEDNNLIYIQAGLCVEIKYLELYEEQLREPHFHRFLFELTPENCTYDKFVRNQKNLPANLEITHPDKPIWEIPTVSKQDFIYYLHEIAPFMLPFLNNRILTLIRYPHGMFGEAFYQKNRPDYAPDFVNSYRVEDIDYIVCNDVNTLVWLGNQLAIEFHIPFQTIGSTTPSEIVLDLDPPSKNEFQLAVKAAILIKEVLDQLHLIGFIKTSGNKGLQIYIPLPEGNISYEETRVFTSFLAEYLISKAPDYFTIERLKKNRGNRLYVDYVQHGEGKTIIAPYSPRGTNKANIATPLFWDEVTATLSPDLFDITNVIERIRKTGDPFQDYFTIKEKQNIAPILDFLSKNKRDNR